MLGTHSGAAVDWLSDDRRPLAARRPCRSSSISRPDAPRSAPCRRSTPILFERFFDESGGMQLVIHSCYGSRVNRAWGLALRKRFCRTFNFELQAAATEDHIVLSLTQAHSFELGRGGPLSAIRSTVRHVLVQALCAAPMFEVRWRWDAGISLALPRFRGGKKVPPQIARMNARGSARLGVPRSGRVRRESAGRDRNSGSSAGAADHPRLSRGCDGHRCIRGAAARARAGRRSGSSRAT